MKRHSVSVRINILILLLVIVICGGLVTAAYTNNARKVDEFYMNRTTQISSTIAYLLDGDKVTPILDVLLTDEYQEIRKKAEEAEDEAPIRDYLMKAGVLDEILYVENQLSNLRDLQGAEYIYLVSVMEDVGITFCDPDEPMTSLGIITKNAGEFGGIVSNIHIDPTVSLTDYGWLCSSYDPVRNSNEEAVCLVGVDINMTDVMAARQAFLRYLLIFSVAMGVIAVVLGIFLMRRSVVRPLKMLSKATDEFADMEKYTRENVINLPIRSKDEIGDLYQKTRAMQISLLDYMDNLAQVTQEKAHISTELSVANRIQADMLPQIFPAFPDRDEFSIYAMMQPAKEVGGDFYDFFLVDDDHLAMVVADVSGKGVPAALFMVIAKTLIKSRAQMGDSPSDILRNVNNQLCEGNEEEFFVTVWLGILEISTGDGWAVNAGHEHPVIRHGSGDFELDIYKHSPAVAVMPDIDFRQHAFHLDPGDAIFVYTDGVPEATNADKELFGNERMLRALNQCRDAKPEEQLPHMYQAVGKFVGDAPQFDDITMLMLEYRGPARPEELEIEATKENLPKVLEFLNAHLDRRNCPSRVRNQLDVAVEEIFVNIASCANGGKPCRVVIRLWETHKPEGISITFLDEGLTFDPLMRPDPDGTLSAAEHSGDGLGIFMVRKSMDDVRYEYKNNRHTLVLSKDF